MKIALGTAQFGLKYGVANSHGRVDAAEVKRILDLARSVGVDTLDTAAAYGSSEEVLEEVGMEGFKVVSKLPPREAAEGGSAGWVRACIEKSLITLNKECLYGFLLHRPLELLNDDGQEIYAALSSLKEQGLIKKLGASVYGPEDLEKLSPHYNFDLVQAPLNIFDRRMLETGWLKRLKQGGTEVHTRSAFLQGLLLMPEQKRPAYFQPWKDLFSRFDDWLKAEKLSPLEACLCFINNQPDVDRILVGVDSKDQLLEISKAVSTNTLSVPASLQSNDPALINPALWTL